MLNRTNLSQARHAGRSSFKDVIMKGEVRVKCNTEVFGDFCGYEFFPHEGKTEVEEFGKQLTTSIYHKLCLIWVQEEVNVKTPVTIS